MNLLLIIIGTTVFFFILGIIQKCNNKKKLMAQLISKYGNFYDESIGDTRREAISKYFYLNRPKNEVDEITYNDIDFLEVFRSFDGTMSSVGSEYSYRALRDIKFDEEVLNKRDTMAEYFDKYSQKRLESQLELHKIGRTNKFSIYEEINKIDKENNKDIIFDLSILISIFAFSILTSFNEKYALGLIGCIIISILSYVKRINLYDDYFVTFRIVVHMDRCLRKLKKINPDLNFVDDDILKDLEGKLKNIGKLSFLLNSEGQDLLSILYSYVNMVFHIDIIAANLLLRKIKKNIASINKLYEIIGEIEFIICIASYRKAVDYYAKPNFANNKKLVVDEIMHPLLSGGVSNSASIERSMLITGSNASGKSTFLRTLAINQILAQTIFTTVSKSYETTFFNIMSSMAIKDSLFNNESYFIVEIKSIKRLLDRCNDDIPLLCFIDEILRGTNTVERISASTVILKELEKANTISIIATHDIELTYLLEKVYENYHFREKIGKDDIYFDYKLRNGRSQTRNAIALLKIIGFSDKIIEDANKLVKSVERFDETI